MPLRNLIYSLTHHSLLPLKSPSQKHGLCCRPATILTRGSLCVAYLRRGQGKSKSVSLPSIPGNLISLSTNSSDNTYTQTHPQKLIWLHKLLLPCQRQYWLLYAVTEYDMNLNSPTVSTLNTPHFLCFCKQHITANAHQRTMAWFYKIAPHQNDFCSETEIYNKIHRIVRVKFTA